MFTSLSSSVFFGLFISMQLWYEILQPTVHYLGLSSSVESKSTVLFVILLTLVHNLLSLSDSSPVLIMTSRVTVVISLLLLYSPFFPNMYFLYEMSLFPVMFSILFLGTNFEKVYSILILVTLSFFFTLPSLYVILSDLSVFGSHCFNHFVVVSTEFHTLLMLALVMKLPIFMLHIWLPRVHVEASTSQSVLLASLLLKLGAIIILRLSCLSVLDSLVPWIMLSLLGTLVATMLLVSTSDLKTALAYSSIVHMNFWFLLLLLDSSLTKLSSYLILLTHGLTSSLLFQLSGLIISYNSSRLLSILQGSLVVFNPLLMTYLLTILANTSLPPFLSFFSELFSLSVIFLSSTLLTCILLFYFMIFLYIMVTLMFYLLSIKTTTSSSFFTTTTTLLSFGLLSSQLNLTWLIFLITTILSFNFLSSKTTSLSMTSLLKSIYSMTQMSRWISNNSYSASFFYFSGMLGFFYCESCHHRPMVPSKMG